MVTTSALPLSMLVTRTLLPKGNVLCAAVAAVLLNCWPLAVRMPELVFTEYQDAFPCWTDCTGQISGNLEVAFTVALPVAAQLGRRIMTPAIARATDFGFRVRFIVDGGPCGLTWLSAQVGKCKNYLGRSPTPSKSQIFHIPQWFQAIFLRNLNKKREFFFSFFWSCRDDRAGAGRQGGWVGTAARSRLRGASIWGAIRINVQKFRV